MVSYHNTANKACKKRKHGMGGVAADTTIGDVKKKKVKVKGGRFKVKLSVGKFVNTVVDKKPVKCEVLDVKDNPANKDYVRRDIVTKGALVLAKTPDGKELTVRVTSSPGQHGVLNGVVV